MPLFIYSFYIFYPIKSLLKKYCSVKNILDEGFLTGDKIFITRGKLLYPVSLCKFY